MMLLVVVRMGLRPVAGAVPALRLVDGGSVAVVWPGQELGGNVSVGGNWCPCGCEFELFRRRLCDAVPLSGSGVL